MVFKGLKNLHLHLEFGEASLIALGVGVLAALVSALLVRRIKPVIVKEREVVRQPLAVRQKLPRLVQQFGKLAQQAQGEFQTKMLRIYQDLYTLGEEVKLGIEVERSSTEYKTVQRIFVYLQVLSAGFVAFAHGANDVANAVGPLAAVISVLRSGIVSLKTAVPPWILALGGFGIVVGLSTWGWRVMITIGKKITELTPTRGFSAEFAAATTIVLASKLGLPISTTHTLVGAVLGVGMARGIGALNLRTVTDIVISWIITIPAGAAGAILFYYILKAFLG